jgi:uroporphyrinogen decarboxylase
MNMPVETMTPRERWIAVLKRQKPDRIPMDYRATDEVNRMMLKHLGAENSREFYEMLHIDKLESVGPRYTGPKLKSETDIFGCRFKNIPYKGGEYNECVYNPLSSYESVEQIEAGYIWPSADWYDYSAIPKQVAEKERYPISAGGWEPFMVYKNLRGEEQAFIDLIESPDIVHYCMDRLFDFYYEMTCRIFEKGGNKIIISTAAEDMGAQNGLMYSPAQIHEFFIPRHKKMMELFHKAGVYALHHSDGAVRPIIPDMIEAGIDILDPVQWRCKGMEREGLKRDFGDRLIFHGGVDNQYTLPFGTVEEVRQEVRDNIDILGRNGGYIMGPCHNIQSVSPPENIIAMYKEAYEYGWT